METFRRLALSWFLGLCAGLLAFGLMCRASEARTDYYAPAEWLFTTETASYFAVESGHIYTVDADPSYNGDHPYLLHMDPSGTSNPTDDIVLVVWVTD